MQEPSSPTISEEYRPKPGDVAISFRSFIDIDAGIDGIEMYRRTDLTSAFEAYLFILNLANLIEAVVTQRRIYCFAWNEGPAFATVPNLPTVTLPIHKTYGEYHKDIAGRDKTRSEELEVAASDYVSFLASHEELNLPSRQKEVIEAQGVILLGDMLRSQELGLNFYPSAIESTSCIYKIVNENVGRSNVARTALGLIESARRPLAVSTNERLKAQVFDVYVPAVFSAVLKEAKDLEQIFGIATQMRDTKEATAFREWAAAIDNDDHLVRISEELDEVQTLADNLARGIEQKPKQIQLQLGVSFIGSVQVEIPISIRRRRKKHLTFLKSLFDASAEISQMNQHLKRVLGIDRQDVLDVMHRFSQVKS